MMDAISISELELLWNYGPNVQSDDDDDGGDDDDDDGDDDDDDDDDVIDDDCNTDDDKGERDDYSTWHDSNLKQQHRHSNSRLEQ